MYPLRKNLLLLLLLFALCKGYAQTVDTAVARQILERKDTIVRPAEKNPVFIESDSAKLKNPRARIPRKAAIRSAILPGWGQLYNKKIWKVPIVYGALGGTAWYFFDNRTWYKRFREGVNVGTYLQSTTDNPKDSSGYNNLNAVVKILYNRNGVETLRYYRDDYRRNIDYAALYFIIAWALNIVDATVDAHLSTFDVSPDLSFKIQPGYSEMARTNGVSLVLRFK